jgi:hypothetical protein
MYGLTIRWSLTHAAAGIDEALRAYVQDESVARFTDLPGLHLKVWEMVDGGFFAGMYIWATEEAREAFLETFRASPSKVTQIVGDGPALIQEWDVVGTAVGGEGFPPKQ